MSKLALVALVLGACVAEDPTTTESSRVYVGNDVTPMNVVTQVEIPTWGNDNINIELVKTTGLAVSGPTDFGTKGGHIDIANVDLAEVNPTLRKVCALSDQLPGSDVCSLLCDPDGLSVRIAAGSLGTTCTQQYCDMGSGISVVVNICVSK